MRGLILKDLYTLARNMRMYLLFMAIIALIPGSSSAAIVVVLAGMMPITALAYDERCGWDALAASMPYTVRQLVMSKYIMGMGLMLAVLLLNLAVFPVMSAMGSEANFDEACMSALGAFWAGIIMQAIMLPIMFRFGTERARIAIMVFMAVLFMIIGAVGHLVTVNSVSPSPTAFIVLGVIGVAAYIVGMPISMRGYVMRNRRG